MFSKTYIAQYVEEFGDNDYLIFGNDLLTRLQKLHKYWYQINLLEKRLSGRSEEKMNQLKGEFYPLAQQVIQSMIALYQSWLYNHTKDGWWKRITDTGGDLFEFGVVNRGTRGNIDLRPTILTLLEEQMFKNMDPRQEFEDTGYSYKADDFLYYWITEQYPETRQSAEKQQQKFLEIVDDYIGRDNEAKAYDFIRSNDKGGNNLLDEYYKWAVETEIYDPRAMVDVEDIYGANWWGLFMQNPDQYPEQHAIIQRLLNHPKLKDAAWDQWLQMWPEYMKVSIYVDKAVQNLNSVLNSSDINQIMSAISLALNVAHNSGLMYEHLDLSKTEMTELSNMDVQPWEQELKQYSKKK